MHRKRTTQPYSDMLSLSTYSLIHSFIHSFNRVRPNIILEIIKIIILWDDTNVKYQKKNLGTDFCLNREVYYENGHTYRQA